MDNRKGYCEGCEQELYFWDLYTDTVCISCTVKNEKMLFNMNNYLYKVKDIAIQVPSFSS